MSIKQEAQKITKAYFADNANSDNVISATQLSELVERDAKTVRAHLRKIAARDRSELHGARWRITQAIASEEVERYMRITEANKAS